MADYITVVATGSIKDLSGDNLASGTFSIITTDYDDNPIPVRIGTATAQSLRQEVEWDVSDGSLVGTVKVPNPAVSNPSPCYFRITIKDLNTNQITTYRKVQITDDGSGTWNFASMATGQSLGLPIAYVTGPVGPQGPIGATGPQGATGNGLQTVSTLSALKALSAPTSSGTSVALLGLAGGNDGPQKIYSFDTTSTATPDDEYVVAPTSGSGRWIRYEEYLPLVGIQNSLGKVFRVFGGIDSLTAGAGTPTDSYFLQLTKILRANLGDGGPGYMAFGTNNASSFGVTYSHSSNCTELEAMTAGSDPQKYGLGGKGIQYTASSSGNFLTWRPNQYWNRVRVYYMWQNASGGSFVAYNIAAGSSDPNKVTVTQGTSDGGAAYTLYHFDFVSDTTQSGISCNSMTAGTVLFGGDFSIDNVTGVSGVTFSQLGKGGQRMSEWNMLDATFQQQWFAAMPPDLFLLQGGMNDRSDTSAATLQTYVQNAITNIKAGAPNCNIVLIRCNDSADAATTNLASYGPMLQALAAANQCGYFSVRDYLGSYKRAVRMGWMNGATSSVTCTLVAGTPTNCDGIHPSSGNGTKIIAAGVARYLGLAANKHDPGPTPRFTSGGGGTASPTGTLTSKRFGSVTSGTTTTVYDLGLINGTPFVYFNVRIAVQRHGTNGIVVQDSRFALSNGTTNDNASVSQGIANTTIYSAAPTDTILPAFTVALATASGRVQVTVTPTNNTQDYTVSGDWRIITGPTSGEFVKEH